MLRRVRALSLLLPVLLGCSSASTPSTPPRSDAAAPVAAPVSAPEPPASLAPDLALETAHDVVPGHSALHRARPLKAPKNGCVLQSDRSLTQAEHSLALYWKGTAAVVVFASAPPRLGLWLETADGAWIAGPEVPLESKAQHATASCLQQRCELAWVDERARLIARTLSPTGLATPRVLASGLDRRFAPAVALAGNVVHYAYTASVDDAMHTLWVAHKDDQDSAPRDLTPAGHGAAASSFVLGAQAPTLIFIDAHAGISPFLELVFDRAGQPGEVVVRTPVSQPYAPPLLSAVQWSEAQVEVVYTAVGRSAMTAIARVPLHKAADPSALLPSSGYGALSFSAARSRRRALFALEVPSAPAPDSPRSLALKLLNGTRTDDGPELGAGISHPNLASGSEAGEYLLTYTRENAVHVRHVTCDD